MSQSSATNTTSLNPHADNLAQNPSIIPLGNSVFSVSQISNILKRHVESQFSNINVKAEISGLKIHTSGHAYFTLKDKDAVIDGVVWRGTALNAALKEGSEVIASGRITTYPARSKYQMIVTQVELSGQGDLMKKLLENKEKFQAEGLFSNNRPLPKFPQKIGVITSETGAVIQDILHRLRQRYPCHVLVWPVLVQGKGTVEQVSEAINGFNLLNDKPDVLVVARGGGSFEDLFAFNEEAIVRAVFESKIPVVSAIGHETDTTLIDYAADLRAPTPTAAAELITPDLADTRSTLIHLAKRLLNSYQNCFQHCSMRYKLAAQGLIDPIKYTQEKAQRLDDWIERLERLKNLITLRFEQQLETLSLGLKPPKHQLDAHCDRLKTISARLQSSLEYGIERKAIAFQSVAARLEQSSYQKTLDKGFCLITTANRKPICAIKDIKNQPIHIRVKDGAVDAILSDVKAKLTVNC
jgi:exodeoxyribonuclease VII large subunit